MNEGIIMTETADFQKSLNADNLIDKKLNVINNGLLGDYDAKGNYIISDQIKAELVGLTKLKKTTFNNSVFCVSMKPGIGELTFQVVYEKDTLHNTAKATLYVLENIYKVNGYFQNTIKTKVGEYTDVLANFIEDSYTKYNINIKYSDVDDGGRDYSVIDDPSLQSFIAAKRSFLLALNRLTEDKYNVIYEEYFEKRLQLLKSLDSDLSRSILAGFSDEYTKIEKYFLTKKDYRALSELLDKCVEQQTLYRAPVTELEKRKLAQQKQLQDKTIPIINDFSKKINNVSETAVARAEKLLVKSDNASKVKAVIEASKEASEKAVAEEKHIDAPKAPKPVSSGSKPPKAPSPKRTETRKKEEKKAVVRETKSSRSSDYSVIDVFSLAEQLKEKHSASNEEKTNIKEISQARVVGVTSTPTIKTQTPTQEANEQGDNENQITSPLIDQKGLVRDSLIDKENKTEPTQKEETVIPSL